MWHNTRRGHNLIRKRSNARNASLNKIRTLIVISCVCFVALLSIGVYTLVGRFENIKASSDMPIVENNNLVYTENKDVVDVYKEVASVDVYNEQKQEQIEEEIVQAKSFKMTFLGELMMGGNIGKSLSYNYMSAFKTISEYTKSSDYTVLNLGTNIIDLKELKDTKSKYITTKSLVNAFNALGVDGVNVATDHMLDFDQDVFNDTKNILKEDYDLIGLKNTIVYAEHDGIKVAIIGVCNEVIGTEGEYTDAGIMMYNLKKLKSMIKEAKKNVNTVVMLTHLGLENTHTVTSIMSWFYKELINAGVDVVLGSHALGLYPVEIYNGKPIVYSMGYLMSDTDYILGKETGIFNLNIDEKGYLESLEITPLYITDKKQTVLYSEYSKTQTTTLLKYLTKNLDKKQYTIKNNVLNVQIEK